MPQPFYSRKHELKVGPRKGETVYSAQPYYYGVISTRQMATQIAEESSLTRADVIAVIDRLVYYCKTHVMLGYKIRFDGLGTFYNEFVTTGTVSTPDEVTAKLVKAIRPAFKPEHTLVNGTYRYSLLPEQNELVKIDFKGGTPVTSEDTDENPDDGTGVDEDPLG